MSDTNRDALDFVDWDELKGKEARGVDKKVDLGEIQGIGRTYVVTKKAWQIRTSSTFQRLWPRDMTGKQYGLTYQKD